MKLRFAPACLLLFTISGPSRAAPEAPLALFTVNSACNDTFDDTLLPFALNLTGFSSEEALGRTNPAQLTQQFGKRSEGLRELYARCRKAEAELEMAKVNPQGNVAQAQASANGDLAAFRNFAHTMNTNPAYAFTADSGVDIRSNQELAARYVPLLALVRNTQPHLKNSEALRSALHSLLGKALQHSVDCRVLEKTGRDPGSCRLQLIARFGEGERRIRSAVATLAPAYSQLSRELAAAETDAANAAAYARYLQERAPYLAQQAQGTEATLRFLQWQMQQLHAQAGALDYYRNVYLWWGNYYYHIAVWFWYSGNPWGYYAYLGGAYWFWSWYWYFNYAFGTITRQLMPSLAGVIRQYENYLMACRQELNGLPARIEAANRDSLAKITALHAKRGQLISTCLPKQGSQCTTYTGKDLL